jgi:Zn ribbon nucleic-acid-binding protein
MYAEDVIKKLRGVTCGYKRTSCPDQLAQALEKELHKNQSAL